VKQYQKKATFTLWKSSTSTKEMRSECFNSVERGALHSFPARSQHWERMSAGPDREGRKGSLFRYRLQPKQVGALGMSAAQKINSSRPVWRIVRASDGAGPNVQTGSKLCRFISSITCQNAQARQSTATSRPPCRRTPITGLESEKASDGSCLPAMIWERCPTQLKPGSLGGTFLASRWSLCSQGGSSSGASCCEIR
jgi:hypothetical protein